MAGRLQFVCYLAPPVGLKRLSLLVALAAALSVVLVPGASAGKFDQGRMGCTGESPATCPAGTVGTPYSLPVFLQDDDPWSCAVFRVSSGTFPPGLSLTPYASDSTKGALITGTPTQPGTYRFFISYLANREASCGATCGNKCQSDDEFIIPINPGAAALPKLTLGPEAAATGTTGTPYSLQMTASVPDAKTWSISSGTLPPGLGIDASTGLISGTPTTAGTYDFTVYAKVNADSRSDTKALAIVVRDPLVVSAGEPFVARRAVGEVSVPFDATISATGGFGTYTWAVTAGTVPPGLKLVDGAITGTPTTAGSYAFIASVTDTEGRKANVTAHILVAEKLSISTLVLRPASVGKLYAAKLKTFGGVKPATWRLFRGPLPRGIRFDRTLGTLAGTPKIAGRYRVTFEATDALGVVSKRTFSIVVGP
jgi:large repetitive protein